MTLEDDIALVSQLLDIYATKAWMFDVFAEDSEDRGVPPTMQVGEVNEDGWIAWRLLPSTLTIAEVTALEQEFAVEFPPLFRAYLLARFHLFDQAKSRRYDHQILLPDLPSDQPLAPLRDLLTAWRPLIGTGYIPFGQWGDGYGPMCFDTEGRAEDDDCPIIWIDHEAAIPLGEEACQQRSAMQPLAQPLYGSFREFLLDVFGRG